jgi:RNA polymerase sigma-70 factor (ECF subfamily)
MADPVQSSTDPRLLSRIRKGPSNADWSDFVQRYGPKVRAWCRHWGLQEADAEDVTQIVLVKLLEKLRTFAYDPAQSFRAWLKTVTRHAWQDFVERQRHLVPGSGDSKVRQRLEAVEAGEDLLQQLEEEFERAQLEEAMARVQGRVESRTWEAFFRLTFLEESGRSVAAALHMGIGAVYMAKNRVQTMLQQEIEKLRAPNHE